jgi:hypothetical protein
MQDHGWQVSDCTAEGLKVMPTLNTFCRNPKSNDNGKYKRVIEREEENGD